MKARIYLDTSVFSALLDDRLPDRQALTVDLWNRRAQFDLSTSEPTREELAGAGDPIRRSGLVALLNEVTVFDITEQMRELADRYVEERVFSPAMRDDALHVAAAVLTRQDILLSWNFKHLVNRVRRARVNTANVEKGFPVLELLAPAEL